MKRYIQQTLDFLLFSNLFIALCAVAQGLVTYQLTNTKPQYHVLGILFFATLSLYNFSILLSKPAEPKKSAYRRVRWIFAHYRLTISLTIIAILSLIPLFLFLSTASKTLLICLALVSIAYNLPLFSIQDKKFGLRNIPGLKLFLIAIVWAISCVLLPVMELETNILAGTTLNDTILLAAKRFLFIAAITVPFDIRDMYQDRNAELKTIPVVLGEQRALLFCQGLLGLYMILLFVFTTGLDANFFALALTIILSGWLIFKSKWKKDEYYYFLLLDGTMILQFLMILLLNTSWL